MREEPLAPIPDEPGQDTDAAEPGPWTDGHGLSGSLDSGYDIDRSADEGADRPDAVGGTGSGSDGEDAADLGHA